MNSSLVQKSAEIEVEAACVPMTLEGIVAAIEEDVIFGRLHPRERLVEDDLMERFDVKRYMVRDALATLDRMGLVERRKNVGALVRSFSAKEVQEVYHLRGLLETEAARLIPLPVRQEDLEALISIQKEHDHAVASSDTRRLFRINLAFHRALFELTGNATLQQAISEYARQTHPIRFISSMSPQYRETARQEHWQIIDALRSGDRDALIRLCEVHLHPARDAYLESERSRAQA